MYNEQNLYNNLIFLTQTLIKKLEEQMNQMLNFRKDALKW